MQQYLRAPEAGIATKCGQLVAGQGAVDDKPLPSAIMGVCGGPDVESWGWGEGSRAAGEEGRRGGGEQGRRELVNHEKGSICKAAKLTLRDR